MDSVNRDSECNIAAQEVSKGSNSAFGQLAETGTERLAHQEQIRNAQPPLVQCRGRDSEALGDWNGRVDLRPTHSYSPLLQEINLWGKPHHPWIASLLLFSAVLLYSGDNSHSVGNPKCNGNNWKLGWQGLEWQHSIVKGKGAWLPERKAESKQQSEQSDLYRLTELTT